MKTLEEVKKDLIGLEVNEDFENEVIIAFGDHEYEGETEVIVSEHSQGYQAYINHAESPILVLKIEDNKIVEVWE